MRQTAGLDGFAASSSTAVAAPPSGGGLVRRTSRAPSRTLEQHECEQEPLIAGGASSSDAAGGQVGELKVPLEPASDAGGDLAGLAWVRLVAVATLAAFAGLLWWFGSAMGGL